MKEDPKVAEAKIALREHFINKKNEPIRTPYYQHQLQVLYENDFFEWIVTDALKELVNEGYVVVFDKENISGLEKWTKFTE